MRKYNSILIGLVCCSVFAAPMQETKDIAANGLKSVLVENNVGKVVVNATDSEKATVVTTKNKFSDNCKITIDRAGTQLVIKVKNTGGLFSTDKCDIDLQVSVPKDVDLDLKVGTGNITVNGTQGEFAFKVGSGSIVADGSFKKIDGATGSGKIAVKGLVGGGKLKSGSGEIDLTYIEKSLTGELDLKVGSGNVSILFPKGAKVKTSFKAGLGELTNELGDNANAAFKVSMEAGSGNLKIKSY